MTPEGKSCPASKSDTPSDSSPSALDWVGKAGLTDQFLGQLDARIRRRRRRQQMIASGLAAMVVLGFVWVSVPQRHSPAAESNVTVILPVQQTLPDGSIVELNETARIVVAFTDTTRRVVLKGGEAHFQVAKNPQKPFVVEADGVEVRAVGTAFLVQLGAQVEVLVTEGRVAVDSGAIRASDSPAGAPAPLFLDAGSQGMISSASADTVAAPQIVTMTEAEIRDRLSWRVPRLEFSQVPLAKVVSLINQHGQVRLVLGDPGLGQVELSGLLRANNVDALLQMLSSNYGIEADRADGQIILRRVL